jgi:hypothetical protein
VMAGIKAGIDIGPLSLSAKGGLYVTFGPDGSLQDIGIRTSTGEGLSVGDVKAWLPAASFQWSFVTGFSSSGLP